MPAQQDPEKWQLALDRIELARRSRAATLDLSGLDLTAIPGSFAQLANLQKLDLRGNRITAIPDSLAQLADLQRLDLYDNQITAIPDLFAQLANLQKLYLGSNKISAIPDSLGQLVNLQTLYLSGNQITTIPDSLAQLVNLQTLDLSFNRITAIPDSLAQLANLRALGLGGNQITAIPGSLAQLANLQVLNLRGNQITVIPDSLAQLANLRVLYLRGNQITAIHDSLAQLANLRYLELIDNGITAIPDSVARLANLQELYLGGNPLPDEILAASERGVTSLFRYLASIATRKVSPRMVKLVLLGEPGSGKTTLLEALRGNPKPCDPNRKQTIGVDVVTLEKSHPTDGKPMYLAAWDFAGQHMEHATHQFFLTPNAIYLIVWSARQGTESGKRDLWYWLELLKMRVREPKYVLVATHSEHTPPDLNLSDIERTYKGCEGCFAVELANVRGVGALEARILELAAGSPSFRAEWNPEWLAVRDQVRKVSRDHPYMTPTEFRRLMKDKGVDGREEQREVARQLNDLGEILYYQERDELASLVILSPEWVSELIALVVRSEEVRKQNGILRKADLDYLWKKARLTPKVRKHLISLMDSFDLTYAIEHQTEVGIVVEALPYSTPDSRKQMELPPDRPQMEMIFRFPSLQRWLPPGIPTWGIARAHRFAKGTPWRDAAAFEDLDTNSQALILASGAAKEIRLRVAADYPPFFFGRMEAILRDTFKRYPGAEPERRLPCRCKPNCGFSHRYEIVLKRRHENEMYVTCADSGENVAIESLLTGFQRPESEEGRRAFEAEMRRRLTELFAVLRGGVETRRPSVVTLVPSRDFKLLDNWAESVTQAEELELTLYCEHESGWHATEHSLYRFRPDRNWFDKVKRHWNKFVGVTRYVGPLAKTIGRAASVPWLEIGGLGVEKLPEAAGTVAGPLASALGERAKPEMIDIEVRYLLEELIDYLDSQRPDTQPKKGGLHPCVMDDGRLLWLCAEHLRLSRGSSR